MLGWLVAGSGIIGLLVILVAMIAMLGEDRVLRPRYWRCTNPACDWIWIGRHKHCKRCTSKGKPRR